MKEKEKEAVIKIADLSFAYPSRDYVFKKFNFNFFKGEYPIYVMLFVVIVGDVLMRNSRFFRQNYYIG